MNSEPSPEIGSLADLKAAFELTTDEEERLKRFDAALLETQSHTNLISRSSAATRWHRHYADALQLLEYLPRSGEWLDIGSGGGFPGLVLAAVAQTRSPGTRFTLCDSVQKKARFLEGAAKAMGLTNTTVRDIRAETLHKEKTRFSVVSARAVTSLEKLLGLSAPLLAPGGLLIFPKGEKAHSELTEAKRRWTFTAESRPSMTSGTASILLLKRPEPRQ
ncbi:MAG: 16S rRNA (guanine(527)-N(7))-methyltransferase RsmG [Parvularcula sp.]